MSLMHALRATMSPVRSDTVSQQEDEEGAGLEPVGDVGETADFRSREKKRKVTFLKIFQTREKIEARNMNGGKKKEKERIEKKEENRNGRNPI